MESLCTHIVNPEACILENDQEIYFLSIYATDDVQSFIYEQTDITVWPPVFALEVRNLILQLK